MGASPDTDSNGRFLIKCAQPGRNGISVSKEDDYYPDTLFTSFLDSRLTLAVDVADGQAVRGVEAHLPPQGGRLTVRVIDAGTQKPVADTKISICRPANLPNVRDPECRVISIRTMVYSQLWPALAFRITVSGTGYEDWYYGGDGSREHAGVLQLDARQDRQLVIALKQKTH